MIQVYVHHVAVSRDSQDGGVSARVLPPQWVSVAQSNVNLQRFHCAQRELALRQRPRVIGRSAMPLSCARSARNRSRRVMCPAQGCRVLLGSGTAPGRLAPRHQTRVPNATSRVVPSHTRLCLRHRCRTGILLPNNSLQATPLRGAPELSRWAANQHCKKRREHVGA